MKGFFSKIDKEVLVILFVLLLVALLSIFMLYRYLAGSVVNVQDSIGGAQTGQNP